MYSGPIFQPSRHQRIHFYLPIHTSLFILSRKGNPRVHPLLLLHMQDRIKENMFIYRGCSFNPSWLYMGLWHHLMQRHPSSLAKSRVINPKMSLYQHTHSSLFHPCLRVQCSCSPGAFGSCSLNRYNTRGHPVCTSVWLLMKQHVGC